MRVLRLAIVLGLAAAGAATAAEPPAAKRVEHVDVYHGVQVADPYRWLEDMGSAETLEWIRAQDTWARKQLAAVPAREALRRQVRQFADVTRSSIPVATAAGLFFALGDGSFSDSRIVFEPQGQPARVVVDRPTDPERVVSRFFPSPSGDHLAYSTTARGSRWEHFRVRVVASGVDLPDEVVDVSAGRSSVSWARDGSGFYYERLQAPAAGAELTQTVGRERLFFHRLGSAQSDDRVVFDAEDEDLALTHALSADGQYLILHLGPQGTPLNRVLYRRLTDEGTPFLPLVADADAAYTFLGNDGPVFWFQTSFEAPRGRVIAIDTRKPERAAWRELIPESADTIDTWIGARAVGRRLLVGYRKDAWLALRAFEPDGRPAYEVALPKVASIWSFGGLQGEPEAFFSLSDFVDPGTVYRLEVASGKTSVFRRPELAYDPDAFVTRQVFFRSKDGTRVPMFLAHKKDLVFDGQRPVFLYGYGAFSWAASPWFQPQVAVWLERGGVYALPNLRGGGEYGEAWHAAGSRRNEPKSIEDFLAAAEWLIAEGISSPARLVANGGSASGPLVGAAMLARPELFAASLIDFPALDMLRLDHFTGGRGWRPEFGSTEDPQDFQVLRAYSPYHNVRPATCYPATLIAPGEKDEVTVPMHAYKFAAALQHAQNCPAPILLRVSWGAGHSYGATNEDAMDTWADQLAFLVQQLGLETTGSATR